MDVPATNYPDWKAPSQDGQILLWPEPAQLLSDTLDNHRRLSTSSAQINGIPLHEARRRLREFVGHDPARPLIATGHQTELYHAGVWAKNVLIDAAATKLNGQAFHLSVDTDAPKHLHVRWPGGSMGLSDDPKLTTAAWAGLLGAPSPARLEQIRGKVAGQSGAWGFEPLLPQVLSSLRKLSMESPSLSAALANAFHELDWQLGLKHHVLLASPIWENEAFLLFVHDWIANAGQGTSQYNAALKSYRDDNGIHSRVRPMPDLAGSDEEVELPFWLDDLEKGIRARPTVRKADSGWVLKLRNGAEFCFSGESAGLDAAGQLRRWLTSHQHRIAPRALTLTMFTRLFLADLFVHGIGGARYDQVTDRLIRSRYQIEPPRFAVTTATLFFPTAVGKEHVSVPRVKQEGHSLKHSLLGSRKRELVSAIDSLPRRSPERLVKFMEMQTELSAAASTSSAMTKWQEKLAKTLELGKTEASLFDREIFYAMQSKSRLESLINQYRKQI